MCKRFAALLILILALARLSTAAGRPVRSMRPMSPAAVIARLLVASALLFAVGARPLAAQDLWVSPVTSGISSAYLFDVSSAYARVDLVEGHRWSFTCDPFTVTVVENRVELVTRVHSDAEPGACTKGDWMWIRLGRLAAGDYDLRVSAIRPDGSTMRADNVVVQVAGRGVKCNANPALNVVLLWLDPSQVDPFLSGPGSDPAWLAEHGNLRFGAPVAVGPADSYVPGMFDALADPFVVVDRMLESGLFLRIGYSGTQYCGFDICGGEMADLVEYRATFREQYFYTFEPAEIAALDGGAIAGWRRTGETIRVIKRPGDPRIREDVFHPVYRFWGGGDANRPSHFFTHSQAECAVVRDRPAWNWTFEGAPFWARALMNDGACAIGTPLRRLYNNGVDGAPTHRYTTTQAVVDEMTTRGWTDEGATMCVGG